jgi:thioredoxin reductase (NADPH)
VTEVRAEDTYRFVRLADGTELACRALVVATGMTTRRLDRPGVDALTGRGVHYGAAPAEARTFRGEHVVVVGGANSAGQGAMLFARHAERVTVAVRGASLEARMSDYLVRQLRATPNIEVRTATDVVGATGTDALEAVHLHDNRTGTTEALPAAAMFVFVGQVPHSEFLRGVVALDDDGFVLTGPDLAARGRRPDGWPLDRDPYPLETSVPGIFAAGDVQHGAVRRVASAVGAGAVAVTLVHQYLEEV